jgi:hypothetical protein
MRSLLVSLVFVSGCAALPDDGALLCYANPARACPDGFQCASDGRCYRNGHGPGGNDLGVSSDMTADDMMGASVDDMSSASDMASMCPSGQSCIYVSAAGSSCPAGMGAGTIADPYCKIQTGLNFGNGKTIVILSGNYNETLLVNPSSVYATTAIAYGAIMQSPGNTALAVGSNGPSVSVTIDGWKIISSDIGANCSAATVGSTKLIVRHSQFTTNRLAIGGTGCDLTVDSSTIGPFNSGGGIGLSGTNDFTVINSLIERNGGASSSTGGIAQDGMFNRAQVINSTVVNNMVGSGQLAASGISCNANGIGSATYTVFNNVVYGNTNGSGEINSSCLPDHDAYVGGSGTNQDLTSCTAAQIFVDGTNNNWRPKTGSSAPCSLIDKGESAYAGVNAPAYDIEGTSRPMGAGVDVGAYESH